MNDDILREIFDECDYRHNQGEFTAVHLRNCALVCQAFREPALRALWKTMSPPTPLWSLVSAEPLSAIVRREGDFNKIVSAELEQSPERWKRFQEYARFVRALEIPERGCESIAQAHFLRGVLNHNGGNSVFPCLQTLSYSPESFLDCSFYALFTPQLRAVTLNYSKPFRCGMYVGRDGKPLSILDVPFEDPIRRLRQSSPCLQSLHLRGTSITTKVLAAIISFEYLREVRLGTVSTTTFFGLLAIPTLASLEIVALEQESDEQMPFDPIRAHTLRELSIAQDCSIVTEVVKALQLPNLRTASLRLVKDDSDAALDYIACLSALVRAVDPAVFEAFSFTAGYCHRSLQHPLIKLLNPLFQLRGLKRLVLRGSNLPLFSSEQECRDILLAWPKLEVFSLSPLSQDLTHPVQIPTSIILDHFRVLCPNLHMLRLPYINLHGREFVHVVPPRNGACHRLATLAIGCSQRPACRSIRDYEAPSGEQVEDVARYVLQLFPALDFTQPALDFTKPWKPGYADDLNDWLGLRSEDTWVQVFTKYCALRGA